MKANNDIQSFDAVLDAKYGAPGTDQRARAEEDAFAYYSGVLLKKARREMRMTQGELRIANALGYSVELVHSIK